MVKTHAFESASPYQDDVLALPVTDLDQASRWYSEHFGMTEVERHDEPVPSVVLERDGVRLGFAINRGDASQDGAAIRVTNIQQMRDSVLDIKLEKLSTPAPDIDMMAFPMNMHATGASGALARMEGCDSGGNSVMVYFNCKDCAVEESRVEAAGGRIHRPKMSIGQYGFITLAIDTEGNMFGLHSRE
jgi:predicted enzyme related to lactoylglutathione lyase